MKENFITKLKNNWILFIIIFQPILDIISYFQSEFFGTSYSWIIRILILVIVATVAFWKSKNKTRLLLKIFPFALFFIIHMANLYRISKFNLIDDTKYFILVFQMPILAILLIDYVKNTNYDLTKIKNGICYNFVIIAVTTFLAYITDTYQYTYPNTASGIIGWFSSANTISMILCALVPWLLYTASNSKKISIYLIANLLSFIILYTNATRSCYLTLLASLAMLVFILFFSKDESKRIVKISITSFFIILSIFAYNFSFTYIRKSDTSDVNRRNTEDIKAVINDSDIENIDFNNLNINDDKLVADILKTSYLYTRIMDFQGEQAVVNAMKPYLSASALSDNRLSKVINAKIEFDSSDTLTKTLGIGYSRISAHELDLENDLQSIYFYYGYIGFAIYISFILYFVIKAIIIFLKNFKLAIHDKEYITLLFLIALLVVGSEYSGAFLRKPNANIYLSLYLLLLSFKMQEYYKQPGINKKKVSFLLLHLGYGGIETSTINTANALSKKYDIELISFYNLKENQTQYINKNISIKYLYDGGPNKDDFFAAIKKKNIFSIIKEGIKSLSILIKKKILIKKEILNSDSFAIVSTRYDFSVLLSKYGKKSVIKIAQEHHHHNNNTKYINTLKNKYKNIDYLFALTESLKNDYKNFLKKNTHTKIIVVPNILSTIITDHSNLNNKNIISICRLHKGKRIDQLINIFSQLKNKDSKLYLIGNGEEEKNLNKLISDLNLQNRIIMTGYLNKEEQLKYLKDSSIFAMTSESEGLPMVLLEAMSFGIPCIAYKTESGVCDIISDNVNGFVINNRCESEYIEKLDLLLSDYNLRKKLSLNCIKTSNNYKEDKILRYWIDVLENNIK